MSFDHEQRRADLSRGLSAISEEGQGVMYIRIFLPDAMPSLLLPDLPAYQVDVIRQLVPDEAGEELRWTPAVKQVLKAVSAIRKKPAPRTAPYLCFFCPRPMWRREPPVAILMMCAACDDPSAGVANVICQRCFACYPEQRGLKEAVVKRYRELFHDDTMRKVDIRTQSGHA